MSILPPEFVIEATLKIGVIYKFTAPELITTEIPHYFVVVAIEDETNYLCVCTTQLNSQLNYVQKKGYDADTLAYLKPTSDNGFTQDTYINCNDYHTISKKALIEKVKTKTFEITGNLNEDEYKIIKESINLSYVNDIPKNLLP